MTMNRNIIHKVRTIVYRGRLNIRTDLLDKISIQALVCKVNLHS